MNKNFEQEYKEYLQKETPDLWDRIEQQLPAKGEKKEAKVYPFRKYGMLIAVCVGVLLLTSQVFLLKRQVAFTLEKERAVPEMAAALMMEDEAVADLTGTTGQYTFLLEGKIVEVTESGTYVIEITNLSKMLELNLEMGTTMEALLEASMEKLEIGKEYELEIIVSEELNRISYQIIKANKKRG